MRKRVYSFLLALCMALSLLPALTPEASAGAATKRISDALAFKQALKADGEVNIVVDADLVTSLPVGSTDAYYITLGTGRKYVNLNGHKVEYNVYFTSPLGSDAERTYIRVPTGAELIILDGSEDKSGKIWAYGKMHSPYDSYTKNEVAYRHVIEVDGGSLTVNGGLIEAGRTKTTWVYQGCNIEDWASWTFADLATIKYRFDGNAYEIVNGNAVTLNGGSVTINGGKLHGRGYRKLSSSFSLSGAQDYTATRAAAICATEGKVTLNGGQLYGAANANCLELGGKVEFELNRAFFETQELKTVLCPVDTPTYSHGQPAIAVIQSDWESYAVGHSSHRNSGAGAGSFNVPLGALSSDCFVWYDGNPYYSEDWNATRITKGDGAAHTLSVSRSGVSAIYASISRPLEGAQTVASVALDLNMTRGLTLTGDTVKCSTTGVESVNTIWYRNSALITGPHDVSYGGYLAKVTVTARKGYKLTSATNFTIGGEKPAMVSAASDGSYAVVWSPAYEFACDHSMNVNPELHYDQNGHYVQCSVCNERIGEEKHTLDAGVASGSVTTYYCLECDYSCQKENGYVKVDFLVADLPVAVGGSEIPTPAVKQEYARIAKVVSWEITDSSGSKLNPGDVYENGKSYTFVLYVKPNDGYYFAPQTAYTYTAVVKLRDEYSFASKVTGSVNGMPAQVKLSGDTATVTCTFPETAAAVTVAKNAAAQDANNPFKDVTQKDAYYYEPILWAYSHQPQITTGTSADTFSPWMTCDRGQVVTFLWRAYGCPEPKSMKNNFTDLTQDWYKKPIQWAVEQGITNGTSETTFTPAKTCSVAETITFLYRAAGRPGAAANPPMWYTDAMDWAFSIQLVQNTSWNGVNPLVDCPRADIVTYLHRQLG